MMVDVNESKEAAEKGRYEKGIEVASPPRTVAV